MIEMAQMAFKLVAWAAEQMQAAQAANAPDWAKWVTAGAYVMSQAALATTEPPEKYETMTPAKIRAYLTPPTWDEL